MDNYLPKHEYGIPFRLVAANKWLPLYPKILLPFFKRSSIAISFYEGKHRAVES